MRADTCCARVRCAQMVTHLSQKLHTEPKVGNGGMHVISQLEPPDPEGDPAVTLAPRMEGVVKSRYTLRMDKEHQSYKDYMKGAETCSCSQGARSTSTLISRP